MLKLITSSKFVQSSKVEGYTLVTVEGIVIVSTSPQPSNALEPIDKSPSFKVIVSSLELPKKAFSPIDSTFDGRKSDVSYEQP